MTGRKRPSYTIQAVDNALDVLEALCDEGDEFRISNLSSRLGMHKTSVFRMLATFENRGYVEREQATGKYRLGLSAYEIGQKFLSRMGLLRKAKPVMERLVREHDEAVYLTLRRGDDVLFLDLVDTPHQVKIISLVGRRYPAATSCAGRVILANSSKGSGEGRRKRRTAEEPPVATPTLLSCHDRGDLGEGIASAATAILNSRGEAVGSLCLVWPEFRQPAEKLERELLPSLAEAGMAVSAMLGYSGHYGAKAP